MPYCPDGARQPHQHMLFTARSNAFSGLPRSANGQASSLARTLGMPSPDPWLVATYLVEGELASWWETVCANSEVELFEHLGKLASPKVAEFSFLSPPTGESWSWTRHQVRQIERGHHAGVPVSVYFVGGGHEMCLENPRIDPASVEKRRVVLKVRPFLHFN